VLLGDRVSSDKRARFKNEIAFLSRNRHSNIVTVLDHGLANAGKINGPFYVMHRYDENLRSLARRGIAIDAVLPLFSQILDGIEAAHLQGAVHRDLKPENILYDRATQTIAIADFGVASFTDDLLATPVETKPDQRLANFLYAAPEQRMPGRAVTAAADIYALGLVLNELFTGTVPHGTEYRSIGTVSRDFSFLDTIVAQMMRQSPHERPASIGELKASIQRHRAEAVSLQRLSKISGTVVKAGEIDEPLAFQPPQLVGFDWQNGTLSLTLDRAVTPDWIAALRQMKTYACVHGIPPQAFSFDGDEVSVRVGAHDVQGVIDHLKEWLPYASHTLNYLLQQKAQHEESERRERLRRERVAEEERLRVLKAIRF